MGMHGWALYLAGETQDAIEITRKALRIDTKPAFLHFNLGLYLLATGKSDEAMTNYQNGLKVVAAPGDAEGSVADLEELEKQRPELKSAAAALRAQLETRMKEVSKAPSGANSPK
jgi:tetratricopeptide (TPR) repeat protein